MKEQHMSEPLDKQADSEKIKYEQARCAKCGALLATYDIYYGIMIIKCHRCKHMNEWKIDIIGLNI